MRKGTVALLFFFLLEISCQPLAYCEKGAKIAQLTNGSVDVIFVIYTTTQKGRQSFPPEIINVYNIICGELISNGFRAVKLDIQNPVVYITLNPWDLDSLTEPGFASLGFISEGYRKDGSPIWINLNRKNLAEVILREIKNRQ